MTYNQTIGDYLSALTVEQKEKALQFIKSLSEQNKQQSPIAELSGSFSNEDIELMTQVIERDCEKVTPGGW
jgi:hypothetical protein